MKKILFTIGILVVLCSAVKIFAPLTVNGDFIKTDPTYIGTATLSHTGAHTYQWSEDNLGQFWTLGPLNNVSSGVQNFASMTRGATFASIIAGNWALETRDGITWLNSTGAGSRTLIGHLLTDDGVHQVQTTSIKATALQLNPTTAGFVGTFDAAGNMTPQAPATSGTGATFTPVFVNVLNISAFSLYQTGKYSKTGNVVDVNIGFAIKPAATTTTSFTISLPVTTSVTPQSMCVQGVMYISGGSIPFTGTIGTGNTVTISFVITSPITGLSFYDCSVHFAYQVN